MNISLVGNTRHSYEIDFAVSEGLDGMKVDPCARSRPTERCLPVSRELNEKMANLHFPEECHRKTAEHHFVDRQ